ncbi:MAG TPA: hypothetical protein VFW06_04000 [Acidimicrobiia bacterium]|nr:hypothetical protein [Acidimicrobiia bacterium]
MRRSSTLVLAVAVALGGSVLTSGAAIAAKAGKCGKAPFTGTVSRTDDGSQPAGEVADGDIESATAYDFGTRSNYTLYLAEHDLDEESLGSTIEAPTGEVLVTIFLGAKNRKDLKAGQRLRTGRDQVTVIIDAGAGAHSVTRGAEGTVTIQKLSKRLVCFSIDYDDEYQQVDGTVRARIP